MCVIIIVVKHHGGKPRPLLKRVESWLRRRVIGKRHRIIAFSDDVNTICNQVLAEAPPPYDNEHDEKVEEGACPGRQVIVRLSDEEYEHTCGRTCNGQSKVEGDVATRNDS